MKQYLLLILFFGIVSARPLKVLFVTDKFPFEPRTYIDNQITGFIDDGVDVTILAECTSPYADYPIAEKYAFKDLTFYNELPLDKRSFDIIYCQFPGIAKQMLIKRNKKLISGIIVGCFRGGCDFNDIERNIDTYKSFFNEVDLILVVCKAFEERLIKYGCPKEKIMVHHSAIDVERFNFKKRKLSKNNTINCITIGRLHEMKGHTFLIKAIAKVKDVYPGILLNIYGDGEQYKTLFQLIQKYGLQETVFLKGYCEHDSVPDVLYKHQIFVMASYTTKTGSQEGIPNVLMEALATGMPVVVTDHSGSVELVEDKKMGFLAKEQDSNELAEKIIHLIHNSDLWQQFGKAGRKKVLKEHNKNIQNKKLIKIFKQMIKKKDCAI